ncbi:MAG: YeiH family protein [Steroidobacteraceae bacterium]
MNEVALLERPIAPHSAHSDRLGHTRLVRLLPGLGLSVLLAICAMQLGTIGWLAAHGVSALTAAIALGILLGNTIYPRVAATAGVGVAFSKQTLLRAGVVLYGLRLTLHDVGQVGAAGVLIDALVVTSTFVLAVTLGTRLFRLDRETSMLIGAGSAICGAAAVMATEPVVRAKADHVTIAVSTVVVFGTAAMFLYPVLYRLMPHGLTAEGARAFGVYTGSTIHEVAQVFAAGRSVSETVANTAVITKMVRVMMLAPFLMGLSAWIARGAEHRSETHRASTSSIPWFAVAFVGVVIFNSLGLLSPRLLGAATTLDTMLLAMAMAALGLTTHLSALRAAGPKPLWLGAVLFGWLIVGGGAINVLVSAWLL